VPTIPTAPAGDNAVPVWAQARAASFVQRRGRLSAFSSQERQP